MHSLCHTQNTKMRIERAKFLAIRRVRRYAADWPLVRFPSSLPAHLPWRERGKFESSAPSANPPALIADPQISHIWSAVYEEQT